jgi:signal transduction histidine kinase
MTEEERRRALERFWRGAPGGGGTGIGLAIASRLVTADGGELRLDEAPAGGLDAVVRLPASRRDGTLTRPGRIVTVA